MKEVYRDISGFEGRYQISNKGQVRTVPKVLKTTANPKYYKHVYLGVHKPKRVHRLVAEHFVPRVKGKDFVNHKDGNKHNNAAENLEWCTKSENTKHAYALGKIPRFKTRKS